MTDADYIPPLFSLNGMWCMYAWACGGINDPHDVPGMDDTQDIRIISK